MSEDNKLNKEAFLSTNIATWSASATIPHEHSAWSLQFFRSEANNIKQIKERKLALRLVRGNNSYISTYKDI